MLPLVTVVLPCRDEERHIRACLRTLLDNGYPLDRLEILVVDGMSTDGTVAVVAEIAATAPGVVRVLENPRQIMAAGTNVGVRAARGDVIFIFNAHTTYAPGYLQTCVEAVDEHGADCVGGVIGFSDQGASPFGPAIRMVNTHPFGVGGARFRTGTDRPRWVDTPGFPGCRREVFERAGLYDETLKYSQDYEFFRRATDAGFRHLLHPAANATYHARDSFAGFVRYAWRNGVWITLPMRIAGTRFAPRHFVPAAAVGLGAALLAAGGAWRPAWGVLAVLAVVYALLAVGVSVRAAVRQRDARLAVTGPIIFLMLHTIMGIGTWWGLVQPAGAARAARRAMGPPEVLARRPGAAS